MRAHTITSPGPAVLLSLLALGALGLLVGGGGGQSAAAIPAANPPVETTITKRPPTGNTAIWGEKYGKPIREVATFEFTANQPGATFECAVESTTRSRSGKWRWTKGKPFSPCTSPLRVGRVKRGNSTARRRVAGGKHELEVRATVGGVTDATPASAYWKALIEG
jgi:hypothetical protein